MGGHHLGQAGDRSTLARLHDLADAAAGTLGRDHPVAVIGRDMIAFHTGMMGDLVLAKTLFEELVATGTRVFGALTDEVLTHRANVAECLGRLGDPAGAVQDLTAILADTVALCGPDDPTTLNCRRLLAHFTAEAGDTATAVPALRALLDDCHRLLDPGHTVPQECEDSLAAAIAAAQAGPPDPGRSFETGGGRG